MAEPCCGGRRAPAGGSGGGTSVELGQIDAEGRCPSSSLTQRRWHLGAGSGWGPRPPFLGPARAGGPDQLDQVTVETPCRPLPLNLPGPLASVLLLVATAASAGCSPVWRLAFAHGADGHRREASFDSDRDRLRDTKIRSALRIRASGCPQARSLAEEFRQDSFKCAVAIAQCYVGQTAEPAPRQGIPTPDHQDCWRLLMSRARGPHARDRVSGPGSLLPHRHRLQASLTPSRANGFLNNPFKMMQSQAAALQPLNSRISGFVAIRA